MDITERKITKIAREAEKLVLLTLREKGVGTAEIDLIHALRPGGAGRAAARRQGGHRPAHQKPGSERLFGAQGQPQ